MVAAAWPRPRCAYMPAGMTRIRPMQAPNLVNRFAGLAAPGPTIGRTLQPNHTKTVIIRIPAGIADDENMITGFQRFASDALAPELAATAPFNSVADGFALVVLAFHVHKGV